MAMRSETFLGAASILMLVGAFSAWSGLWGSLGPVIAPGSWSCNATFVGGILLLIGTAMGYILGVENRSWLNSGICMVGGLLGIVGASAFLLDVGKMAGWGVYLTIMAGFWAILGSLKFPRFRKHWSPAIPKGISEAPGI